MRTWNKSYTRAARAKPCAAGSICPASSIKSGCIWLENFTPDYQENFTKGFDAAWLKAAGVAAEAFIQIVKKSITDGQVADWVASNVKKTDAEKKAFNDFVLNRGRDDDAAKARLKMRKEQAGLAQRDDIQTFVDFIDADEKRI